MEKGGHIYIVANQYRTTFYIGVTSNLAVRSKQHKDGSGSQFTKKHACKDLIYYEFFHEIEGAIAREKQLKNWKRTWKESLIKEMNPLLRDLYDDVADMK